jgi:hypothetical protein
VLLVLRLQTMPRPELFKLMDKIVRGTTSVKDAPSLLAAARKGYLNNREIQVRHGSTPGYLAWGYTPATDSSVGYLSNSEIHAVGATFSSMADRHVKQKRMSCPFPCAASAGHADALG